MGLSRVICRAQWGLTAPEVAVEVHLGAGLPCFNIVGLPATEVKESRDRVRAALTTSGFEIPAGRITVNLAPADLPKDGGRFDLAIALGILAASGQLTCTAAFETTEFLGELGLDGTLRSVRGALPTIVAARRAGRSIIVPEIDRQLLTGWPEIHAQGARSLLEACARLEGRQDDSASIHVEASSIDTPLSSSSAVMSLDDVRGQSLGKLALEVAAAGGHSLLMVGPPGCGKSLLAARLPGLLPPLSADESLEVAMIASVCSPSRSAAAGLVRQRPFRTPHHTASAHALIGGGATAQPGEITLAHRGVLFLDELPEFDRRVLEALREPLETGRVTVVRVGAQADYPAQFQLVAAMNPCPCGHQGERSGRCRCRPAELARYRARLSGPLLDRLDVRVNLEAVTEVERAAAIATIPDAARHEAVCARIAMAHRRQRSRQGHLNARLDATQLDALPRSAAAAGSIVRARRSLGMSLRAEHRWLRVALTVADLENEDLLEEHHLAMALTLRRAYADTG